MATEVILLDSDDEDISFETDGSSDPATASINILNSKPLDLNALGLNASLVNKVKIHLAYLLCGSGTIKYGINKYIIISSIIFSTLMCPFCTFTLVVPSYKRKRPIIRVSEFVSHVISHETGRRRKGTDMALRRGIDSLQSGYGKIRYRCKCGMSTRDGNRMAHHYFYCQQGVQNEKHDSRKRKINEPAFVMLRLKLDISKEEDMNSATLFLALVF
uniref:Zn_ribbon_recom domain-containing protein n=1 Tax=Heterorhabditis bacteriophora TaxID=37862 RepID=A0A1I7WG00_HETBA